MNTQITEWEPVTGGCLWGCSGDSIDGHTPDCNWHIVECLQKQVQAAEALVTKWRKTKASGKTRADLFRGWMADELAAALRGEVEA